MTLPILRERGEGGVGVGEDSMDYPPWQSASHLIDKLEVGGFEKFLSSDWVHFLAPSQPSQLNTPWYRYKRLWDKPIMEDNPAKDKREIEFTL